ncbi:GNAT family N-acetyltransferase [Algoriphagus sediminis]|uniref:GNAT family N-acetyltransferase n=1 Tax=Algoriphagus sediminis TaxID=3057113 RepID=A0ABT7Y9U5_9BACT|nr:GNAT family N-acetyltransferase [Algoriphagus sediminis]MDN3203282.1 GNAT family N-acetyltransferase [Algoriphagus sediminis]
MNKILRTDTESKDFQRLVRKLDAYLAEIDGEENAFYSQYNKIEFLDKVVVLYQGEVPVACGAMKPSAGGNLEIKRMYTLPEFRGRGLASQVVHELEKWAKESGAEACVLETGKRQKDAVALYKKLGYQIIPNFEPYVGVENSLCFEKKL